MNASLDEVVSDGYRPWIKYTWEFRENSEAIDGLGADDGDLSLCGVLWSKRATSSRPGPFASRTGVDPDREEF